MLPQTKWVYKVVRLNRKPSLLVPPKVLLMFFNALVLNSMWVRQWVHLGLASVNTRAAPTGKTSNFCCCLQPPVLSTDTFTVLKFSTIQRVRPSHQGRRLQTVSSQSRSPVDFCVAHIERDIMRSLSLYVFFCSLIFLCSLWVLLASAMYFLCSEPAKGKTSACQIMDFF